MADSQDSVNAYQSVATNTITALSEIDRLVKNNKAQTFKLLDARGAIGFKDMFGVDMGREAQRMAETAIDDLAAKQRAEVIDLARSNLEAIRNAANPPKPPLNTPSKENT